MARADRSRDEPATAPAVAARRTDHLPGRRRPPRPTVLLLVRHGSTATTGQQLPGRAPGLHLSDAGREQADRVAARIAGLAAAPGEGEGTPPSDGQRPGLGRARRTRSQDPAVAAVYASPLERARETAAPIARALGHEVVVDEGLIELDVGDWTGVELKAARKRKEWATIQRYPSGFTFPGGESFVDMQARIIRTIDRLRAAHAGQTIVAVSHADPIRAAVAHAVGSHLDLFQRLVVSPCSLTAIAYGAEGPTVLTVNDTGASGALMPS